MDAEYYFQPVFFVVKVHLIPSNELMPKSVVDFVVESLETPPP